MDLVLECPHCNSYVIINSKEINCGIFRHGAFKTNGEQIPPHLNQTDCEELVRTERINGCGRPFMYKGERLVICEYV